MLRMHKVDFASHDFTFGKWSEKDTFQIGADPCKVVGLAEPRHVGSEPADSSHFHNGFPFTSKIFLTSSLSL